jgi:hypothetical protein
MADLSLYVLSPLVAGFPSIPICLMCTCNSFTAKDVRYHYGEIVRLHEKSGMRAEIGPLLAYCSDGDARRCTVQLEDHYRPSGLRWKAIDHPSWTHSLPVNDSGIPSIIHGQDPFQ